MIRIKISNYSQHDSLYVVRLGNATIHHFTNEKHAVNFLCQTSNFLTRKFNELNLLYSDSFQIYRELYFYFDNDKHNPHACLYQSRRNLKEEFFTVEEQFEKLSFSYYTRSHNYFPFKYLFSICDRLINCILILRSVNASKSYHSTDIRLNYLLQQIQNIRFEIQNYSFKTATQIDVNFRLEAINDNPAALQTA